LNLFCGYLIGDPFRAYQVSAALEERTRERVPLQWAATQYNLGIALETLGERESGTASLEAAVEAYRAAPARRVSSALRTTYSCGVSGIVFAKRNARRDGMRPTQLGPQLGLTDDSSPPRPPALLRQRVQPLHQAANAAIAFPAGATATWDNLQFGLRLGRKPRQVIATTPKPIALLRELVKRAGQDVVITRGTTYDNRANLAAFSLRCRSMRPNSDAN